jgi:hypothetical protein
LTSFDSLRAAVSAQTAILAPTLYDSLSVGIESARRRMAGRDLARYPAQFSGLVRMDVREDLEARAIPNSWVVGGDPRKMGQLLLENEELGLVLRFLKENRLNAGGVPHAGANRLRRATWKGNQFSSRDEPFDGFYVPALASPSEPETCLLLWSPRNSLDLDLGFTLRVVHTVEPGDHLRGVACDMDIEVLQGGLIFEHLEFGGSDEAGDLFHIDAIAEESDEE